MNRATNDLISRSVLIDELMAGCMPIDLSGLSGVTGDELTIRDYIDSAPSVNAVPVVHGRWIKYESDMHGIEPLACNVCNYLFARLYPQNYCPNCGAKMETTNE